MGTGCSSTCSSAVFPYEIREEDSSLAPEASQDAGYATQSSYYHHPAAPSKGDPLSSLRTLDGETHSAAAVVPLIEEDDKRKIDEPIRRRPSFNHASTVQNTATSSMRGSPHALDRHLSSPKSIHSAFPDGTTMLQIPSNSPCSSGETTSSPNADHATWSPAVHLSINTALAPLPNVPPRLPTPNSTIEDILQQQEAQSGVGPLISPVSPVGRSTREHSSEDNCDSPRTLTSPKAVAPTGPSSPHHASTHHFPTNSGSAAAPQPSPARILPPLSAGRTGVNADHPQSPSGRLSLTVNKPPVVLRPFTHRSIDYTGAPPTQAAGSDWLASALAPRSPVTQTSANQQYPSSGQLSTRPLGAVLPPTPLPGQTERAPSAEHSQMASLNPHAPSSVAAAEAQHNSAALPRRDLRIDVEASKDGVQTDAAVASPSHHSKSPFSALSSSSRSSSSTSSIHSDFKSTVFNHLLSEEQLKKFILLFTRETWKANELVCQEGERSERLIVWSEGQVLLYAKKPPGMESKPASKEGVASQPAGSSPELASLRADAPGNVTSYTVLSGQKVKIIRSRESFLNTSPPGGEMADPTSRTRASGMGSPGMKEDEEDMPYFDGPAEQFGGDVPLQPSPFQLPLQVMHTSPSHLPIPLPPSHNNSDSPSARLKRSPSLSFLGSASVIGTTQGGVASRANSTPNISLKPPPTPPSGTIQLSCLTAGSILGAELFLEASAGESSAAGVGGSGTTGTTTGAPLSSPYSRGGLMRKISMSTSGGDEVPPSLKLSVQRRPYSARVSPLGPAVGYVISHASLQTFLESNANLRLVFHIGLGAGLPALLAKHPLFAGVGLKQLGVLWSLGALGAYKTADVLHEEGQPTTPSGSDADETSLASGAVRFICKGSILLTRGNQYVPAYSGHKYRSATTMTSQTMDELDAQERRDDERKRAEQLNLPDAAKTTVLNHESVFGLEEALLGVPFTQTAATLTPTLLWEVSRKTLLQWSALQVQPANPAAASPPAPPRPTIASNLFRSWDTSISEVILHGPHLSSLLLHSRPFQRAFAAFLSRELSSENLRFMVYIAKFRQLPVHDAILQAPHSASVPATSTLLPFVATSTSTAASPAVSANSSPRKPGGQHTLAVASSSGNNTPRSSLNGGHRRTPSANLRKSMLLEAQQVSGINHSTLPSNLPSPQNAGTSLLVPLSTTPRPSLSSTPSPSALLESALLEMHQIAQRLYDQFLSPSKSPYQLQLHPITRARILHQLSSASARVSTPSLLSLHLSSRTFRDAEYEITDLLWFDSFVRFRGEQRGETWKRTLREIVAPSEKGFYFSPSIGATSSTAAAAASTVGFRSPSATSMRQLSPHGGSVIRSPFASLLGAGLANARVSQQRQPSVKSGSYRLSAVEWGAAGRKNSLVGAATNVDARESPAPARTPEPVSRSVGPYAVAEDTDAPAGTASPRSFLRFLSPASLPLTQGGAASAAASEADQMEAIHELPKEQRRIATAAAAKRRASSGMEGLSPAPGISRASSPTLGLRRSPIPSFAGGAYVSSTAEADAAVALASAPALGQVKRELLQGQTEFASFQIAEEPGAVASLSILGMNPRRSTLNESSNVASPSVSRRASILV